VGSILGFFILGVKALVKPEGLFDSFGEDGRGGFDVAEGLGVEFGGIADAAAGFATEDQEDAEAFAGGVAADGEPLVAAEGVAIGAEELADGLIVIEGEGIGAAGLGDDGAADDVNQGGICLGVEIEVGTESEMVVAVGEIDGGVDWAEAFEDPFHGAAEDAFDIEFVGEALGEFGGGLGDVELLGHVLVGADEVVAEEIDLLADFVASLIEAAADGAEAFVALPAALDLAATADGGGKDVLDVARVEGGEEHIGGTGAEGIEAGFAAAGAREGDDIGVAEALLEHFDESDSAVVGNLEVDEDGLGGQAEHLGVGGIEAGGVADLVARASSRANEVDSSGVGIDDEKLRRDFYRRSWCCRGVPFRIFHAPLR
jgi:hypothetical protein